jgi:hypothetical protein
VIMENILGRPENKNNANRIYIYWGVIIMLLSYSVFFIFDKPTVFWIATEDGPFETSGAILFLLCSGVFAMSYFKHKNWIFLLLALIFFFGAGEEISWGQRIFHVATPGTYKKINALGELNIHNLKWFNREEMGGGQKSFVELLFNFDRLFSVFWFLWCFTLPLLALFNISVNRWLKKISLQIPRVPFNIGCLFLINYLVSKIMEFFFLANGMRWPIAETKEYLFAFLFFLVSIEFRRRSTDDLY